MGGEVDNQTAAQLWATLVAAFDGTTRGVVDLTITDFLDSSGLGVLVGMHRRQLGNGGTLRVACPKAHLRKLFASTHLDEVSPVSRPWKRQQPRIHVIDLRFCFT